MAYPQPHLKAILISLGKHKSKLIILMSDYCKISLSPTDDVLMELCHEIAQPKYLLFLSSKLLLSLIPNGNSNYSRVLPFMHILSLVLGKQVQHNHSGHKKKPCGFGQ